MTRHVVESPLRWGDMDAQAHVNNTAWVDHLQEARVDLLLRGPLAPMLDSGVLVVSHAVEFLGAVVADAEPLRIELWVADIGAARFTLAYELSHHGRLVGRARTVATPYDLATGTLRRLTAGERAELAVLQEDTEPLRPLATGALDGAVEFPLTVRWSDLDSYGHVNNVMFYEYVQEARVAFLGGELATEEGMWVVARQDMRYRRPLPHRLAPYAVRIGVVGHGRTSITVAAQIVDPADGTVFAHADTVVVATDRDGRPRPVDQSRVTRVMVNP